MKWAKNIIKVNFNGKMGVDMKGLLKSTTLKVSELICGVMGKHAFFF